jgi:hypothetical protein
VQCSQLIPPAQLTMADHVNPAPPVLVIRSVVTSEVQALFGPLGESAAVFWIDDRGALVSVDATDDAGLGKAGIKARCYRRGCVGGGGGRGGG